MITIELTHSDAELFKKFREYQEIVVALQQSNIPKVFSLKGGKAIFNFGKGGTLVNIILNDFEVYRRKRLDSGS